MQLMVSYAGNDCRLTLLQEKREEKKRSKEAYGIDNRGGGIGCTVRLGGGVRKLAGFQTCLLLAKRWRRGWPAETACPD